MVLRKKENLVAVRSLTKWYLRARRRLPWRESHDPYRIWVSEVMLQQTQVAAVIPYYDRFLQRLPTLESLASAPEEVVLTLWSGLGYYSRARNLQRGAKYVVSLGEFPKTRKEILKVPGIGPYTAGAILSICFNLNEPLVDGNVQRVFSRFFGWEEEIETSRSREFFWKKAEELVALADSPRDFNQGLMELGATVCFKGSPLCSQCPWEELCVAKEKDVVGSLPRRKKRRDTLQLDWTFLVHEQKGQLFLRKNRSGEWWADLWDFPRIEKTTLPKGGELLGSAKHTVTHHRISAKAYLLSGSPHSSKNGRWFSKKEVSELPLSSLSRKIFLLVASDNVN